MNKKSRLDYRKFSGDEAFGRIDMNKRFRVNNLTVAVGNSINKNFGCGINFSCPGGPAGSFCNQFTPPICNGFSRECVFTRNCGLTFNCGNTIDCLGVTLDGCGLNFSTLPPTDITKLVQLADPVEQVELIAGLKEDLGAALKELENVEVQAAASAAPQTLAEATELETQLKGALAEVKEMKKNLK